MSEIEKDFLKFSTKRVLNKPVMMENRLKRKAIVDDGIIRNAHEEANYLKNRMLNVLQSSINIIKDGNDDVEGGAYSKVTEGIYKKANQYQSKLTQKRLQGMTEGPAVQFVDENKLTPEEMSKEKEFNTILLKIETSLSNINLTSSIVENMNQAYQIVFNYGYVFKFEDLKRYTSKLNTMISFLQNKNIQKDISKSKKEFQIADTIIALMSDTIDIFNMLIEYPNKSIAEKRIILSQEGQNLTQNLTSKLKNKIDDVNQTQFDQRKAKGILNRFGERTVSRTQMFNEIRDKDAQYKKDIQKIIDDVPKVLERELGRTPTERQVETRTAKDIKIYNKQYREQVMRAIPTGPNVDISQYNETNPYRGPYNPQQIMTQEERDYYNTEMPARRQQRAQEIAQERARQAQEYADEQARIREEQAREQARIQAEQELQAQELAQEQARLKAEAEEKKRAEKIEKERLRREYEAEQIRLQQELFERMKREQQQSTDTTAKQAQALKEKAKLLKAEKERQRLLEEQAQPPKPDRTQEELEKAQQDMNEAKKGYIERELQSYMKKFSGKTFEELMRVPRIAELQRQFPRLDTAVALMQTMSDDKYNELSQKYDMNMAPKEFTAPTTVSTPATNLVSRATQGVKDVGKSAWGVLSSFVRSADKKPAEPQSAPASAPEPTPAPASARAKTPTPPARAKTPTPPARAKTPTPASARAKTPTPPARAKTPTAEQIQALEQEYLERNNETGSRLSKLKQMNAQRALKRNAVLQDIPETRTFTPSIPEPRTPTPRPKTPTPQPRTRTPKSRTPSRAATEADNEVEQFLGQEPQAFVEAPSRMETRSKSRLTPALLEPVAMPVPAPAPARAPSTKGVPAMATEDIPPPPPTTAPPKDKKKKKAQAEVVQIKVRLAGGTTVDGDLIRGNDGVDYAVPADPKNLRKFMTAFEAENREGFKRFTAAFGHPFKSSTDVAKNVGNAHKKVYESLYGTK